PQPALGARAEAAPRNRPRRRRLRPHQSRCRRVRGPGGGTHRLPAPSVRSRRQVLRVDRHRMHRRPPSLRGYRRGDRPAPGEERSPGRRTSPGRGEMTEGHGGLLGTAVSPDVQTATAMEPLLLAPDGPSVVAIGGGHGLAAALEAVQLYAGKVTAIVSVADDGGSSGRLIEGMKIPAPGDIRRCLLALTPEPTLVSELFAYRFASGDVA